MLKTSKGSPPGRTRNEKLLDYRLARTPYLVIPKLAVSAMPVEWQDRLEALLVEAEEMGMETPDYRVFRDLGLAEEDPFMFGVKDVGSWDRPFYRFGGRASWPDPWANYRHGKISDLCPSFKQEGAPKTFLLLKRGVYYWAPESAGYVLEKNNAGRYSAVEALEIMISTDGSYGIAEDEAPDLAAQAQVTQDLIDGKPMLRALGLASS